MQLKIKIKKMKYMIGIWGREWNILFEGNKSVHTRNVSISVSAPQHAQE